MSVEDINKYRSNRSHQKSVDIDDADESWAFKLLYENAMDDEIISVKERMDDIRFQRKDLDFTHSDKSTYETSEKDDQIFITIDDDSNSPQLNSPSAIEYQMLAFAERQKELLSMESASKMKPSFLMDRIKAFFVA